MSSSATAGKGAEFRRWDTTTGAWVVIAEIRTIGGPNMSRATIDVTSLDSTDGYLEFLGSFRDGGSVDLAMLFLRDEYEVMKDDFEDDTLQNYEIVLPDLETTSLEFTGLVTELGLAIPHDDVISSDTSIKISGPVTLNSGSGPSPA